MIWFRSRVFVVPGTPITIRSSIPAREASGSVEERGCRRVVVLARPSTRINTLLSPSYIQYGCHRYV